MILTLLLIIQMMEEIKKAEPILEISGWLPLFVSKKSKRFLAKIVTVFSITIGINVADINEAKKSEKLQRDILANTDSIKTITKNMMSEAKTLTPQDTSIRLIAGKSDNIKSFVIPVGRLGIEKMDSILYAYIKKCYHDKR